MEPTFDRSNLLFRKLESRDYDSFLSLINEFRETNFTASQFVDTLFCISLHSDIYVVEYEKQLIATATLLYEKKFIHHLCILGHIEDVCVRSTYRKHGLGKYIISNLVEVAREKKCYKITLDCADDTVEFYQKCNFSRNGNQMSLYF